ncbi:MAG: hypothetical protein ACREBS_10650 [Nitrososphaerales archaeon]
MEKGSRRKNSQRRDIVGRSRGLSRTVLVDRFVFVSGTVAADRPAGPWEALILTCGQDTP